MNIEYIKQVYNNLTEVLASDASLLAELDRQKLNEAKLELETALAHQPSGEVSFENQLNYLQLIILIAEIIKNMSDHFK